MPDKEKNEERGIIRKGVDYEGLLNKDLIPFAFSIPGTQAATDTNYTTFFHALRPYEIIEIAESHTTAGSDAGSVTLNIERLSGTESLTNGDDVCVSAFDLKGTADTVVTKKTTDLQNRTLTIGDRLALKDSGTLTDVAGVTVTLLLKPLGKGHYA